LREKVHKTIPSTAIDIVDRTGWVVATGSECIPLWAIEQMEFFQMIGQLVGTTVSDALGIKCSTGTASGIVFAILLTERRHPTAKERKRWSQIATHLGAGLRLRGLARGLSLDACSVEAVFDSKGNLHDARAQAVETIAQVKLRQAVQSIEHSRTVAGRRDADAALDNWQGLVDGRWSLVDYFDTDGRRFIIAVKNDPAHPDPRGLTQRERQIAEYVGMGYATKEIAYNLGVSAAAVNNGITRIQVKLGLSSRIEVTSFFAPNGLRQKLATFAMGGEQLLFGTHTLIDEEIISCLTEAEREVTAQMIAGSTNGDIARRRGISEHTVVNQVHSIYAKLHVCSRAQLAARLHSPGSKRLL
jgi:DNA-binding NarL/FixJ family response regulator